MPAADRARSLLEAIEAEHLRLRALLSGHDSGTLAARPPNGKWSVMGNLRHLVFAERMHLGQFIPRGHPLSLSEMAADEYRELRNLRMVAVDEPVRIDDVLGSLESFHLAAREFVVQDTEKVLWGLDVNLRHLRSHIAVIERLLRRAR